ncbi:MAG: MATE family efflux transporter [Chloroflexi bacterium]|nr:MATE family efflux transporter [Chloroflexota bacterium]
MSRDTPPDEEDLREPVDDDAIFASASATRGNPRRERRVSAYATRDLTSGGIKSTLWFLAWPQMVGGVFNATDQLADLFWAGMLGGFHAIAGVGVAQTYAHLMMMARQGLDVGMQALIARAVGARRIDLANHAALQAFTLVIVISIVMVTGGVLFARPLLSILGTSDDVIAATTVFLQYQFVSAGAQAFRQTAGAVLQASGDTLTNMKSTMASRILHLALSPFFIFGWLGLPEMGLAGAAMANIVAQMAGTAWNLYALFSGTSRIHLSLRGYHVDPRLMWRILRIGGPASVTQMERGVSELVLVRLVTPFGDLALAAYSLTRRLERLTNIGSQGVGRASGIIAGQNLGAGKPERARVTVRWAVLYVMLIRGSAGLLLIIFPAFFVSIFSDEREFVETAVIWVQIQAVAGIALGGGQVFQQSFNIAGDTLAPMLVTFMSMWVMEIPLAFVLTKFSPLDELGVPVAIAIAMFFRFALYGGYFLTGRWLRVAVLQSTDPAATEA